MLSPLEAIAIAAVTIFGLVIIGQIEDTAQDALDKERELSDRIFEIQTWITDHWIANQYAQQILVQDVIYGLSAPPIQYQAGSNEIHGHLHQVAAGALNAVSNYESRYAMSCGSSCTRPVQIAEAVAITHAANHVMRHMERRFYSMDFKVRKLAVGAYQATREQPDAIFALLSSAQGNYANIASSAIQNIDVVSSFVNQGLNAFINTSSVASN